MDPLNKMHVMVYDASGPTYTDRSAESFDYSRDTYTIALETGDYLYLGRRKQFAGVYAEVSTVNAVTTTLSAQYHNGTTWTDLDLSDQTKAFKRSGFIKWTLPVDSGLASTWESYSVNSLDLYWVRLSVGANLTGTTALKGLCIVFADDEDLKREDYGILSLLPEDEDEVAAGSHILSHEAAREAVIDHLRRSGRAKIHATTGQPTAWDEWDLLDLEQIRLAAVYKALSKIYFAASDNPEDVYWRKAETYDGLYQKAMEMYLLSLDADDNGQIGSSERVSPTFGGTFYRG